MIGHLPEHAVAFTELFARVEHALGHQFAVFVRTGIRRAFVSPEEPATAFGVISAERLYTRALEHYASIAAGEIKLRPPLLWRLAQLA
jgi:hypothetical protein